VVADLKPDQCKHFQLLPAYRQRKLLCNASEDITFGLSHYDKLAWSYVL
jgi:hypothetical protein